VRPSQLWRQDTGEQVALQREPYELRGSRPVLRGREGEIASRYSPGQKDVMQLLLAIRRYNLG
jgi:hypothetical protein